MSGKTTFKSIFTRGSKNEQIGILEKAILDEQAEIESTAIILEFISVMLIHEIDKFKQYKMVQYQDTLRQVAQLELKQLVAYGGLLQALMLAVGNIHHDK